MDISCRVHAFGVAALLSTTIIASSAQAIEVAATNDAMAIADQLFLSQSSISVTGATLSFGEPCEMIDGVCFGGEFGEGGEVPPNLDIGLLTIGVSSGVDQIGTYTNNVGTFGLPSPGVVMSTGNVMDYGTGPKVPTLLVYVPI